MQTQKPTKLASGLSVDAKLSILPKTECTHLQSICLGKVTAAMVCHCFFLQAQHLSANRKLHGAIYSTSIVHHTFRDENKCNTVIHYGKLHLSSPLQSETPRKRRAESAGTFSIASEIFKPSKSHTREPRLSKMHLVTKIKGLNTKTG